MTLTEFQFTNSRGQTLVGYEFMPQTKPWATLVWNHGVCEHAGRYIPVFEHLSDAGIAVYTFDVHGHGKSEPKAASDRCLITSYKDLVDDLYCFVSVVEQRTGGRLPADSTFLGGQSMGGLVAALSALKCQLLLLAGLTLGSHPAMALLKHLVFVDVQARGYAGKDYVAERWAGLVVFSGAMGVVWTLTLRVQAALGNLLASVIPRHQMVPAVKPENLHPQQAVVQRFVSDPLVFHGDLRVRTGNELLKAMTYLAHHRKQLQLPIYAVHGTNDHVTSCEAIEAFTNGVISKDVTLSKVEGGYHEMLMGDERFNSADGVIEWMQQRVGKQWATAATAEGPEAGSTAASKL
eukprot:gene10127-10285_t